MSGFLLIVDTKPEKMSEEINLKKSRNRYVLYNSHQKKIRFPLKYNLKKGTHTLYVQASDRVGNRSIVKGDFFIK